MMQIFYARSSTLPTKGMQQIKALFEPLTFWQRLEGGCYIAVATVTVLMMWWQTAKQLFDPQPIW